MNKLKENLTNEIRAFNAKGWSPATSTNYSFLDESSTIWVSRSGVDKSQFTADDFITVDKNGRPTGQYASIKPSAETLIHCVLYDLFPNTKVILHSHSVFPVLLSAKYENSVEFTGYEVQKGFAGQTTHDATVSIPIFENTQDMAEFSKTMVESNHLLENHCFIIRKHGIYAWGTSLFEAKRHLETLEYLSEVKYRELSL
ncbi:MAG: methylthioribulose 1-phosphate dehydratase [Crocinitomicaceae bacterium]|nr:methylthioribulose 1-phosphate dehydratase [Crocinitomicaceae bacterium]